MALHDATNAPCAGSTWSTMPVTGYCAAASGSANATSSALLRMRASQFEWPSLDSAVLAGKLLDFDGLILRHAGKPLRLGIAGPVDLEPNDLGRAAQADVLLERRAAERAAAAGRLPDGARLGTGVLHRNLDLRADGRPVGPDSHQPHAQPIVAVAGILEQAERMGIARDRATDHFQDVLVAVVV